MNISKIQINRFKDLYLEEYNIKLGNEEAIYLCHQLVNLVKAVYKPISREEAEDLKIYLKVKD